MTLGAMDAFFLAVAAASLLLAGSNVLLVAVLQGLRSLAGPAKHAPGADVALLSVVVPAYNEEANIAAKIATLHAALQRAGVPFEVLIGSDGSTDRTNEVVRAELARLGDGRWQLLEFPNEGKCATLNKLVARARGEIITATDADIPLPPDCLVHVVAAFRANGRLGCISCTPAFEGLDIGHHGAYWGFEDRIRRAESGWGRLIVVTGMLSAFRKDCYEPIPAGVMADDLWIPLNVLLKGRESVQVDALRVPYEKTDEKTEVSRRKRVMVGGMDVVRRLWTRLFTRPSVLLLVVFHKVNRWALPLWALLFLAALAAFQPWLIVAYAAGAVLVLARVGVRRFRVLAYSALSPLLSFAEVLRRRDFARWEHTRKS